MHKPVYFFIGLLLSMTLHAEITAEKVLGEYWNDPLFGEAAATISHNIDVLNGQMWPPTISVPIGQNVRFVFNNQTHTEHLFGFSESINSMIENEEFQNFIKDELYHARQKKQSGNHHHHHQGNSVDDAQAIVKTLDQKPTVMLTKQDLKEILLRFDKSGKVELRCVMPEHQERIKNETIEVYVYE